MKRIVVILVFVCNIIAFLPVKGQEYIPFLTTGKWTTIGYNLFNIDIYGGPRFIYTLGDDTVIVEGKNYNTLYCNNVYCCAIREEDKRVYVNFSECGEHLLYDFNLEIGDTVFYTLGGYGSLYAPGFSFNLLPIEHYKVVESIDSIRLKTGEYRKRWKLSTKIYFMNTWTDGFDDNYWIEGIGDITWIGFFNPFVITAYLNGDNFDVTCFSEGDSVVYQSDLVGTTCADCNCRLPVINGIAKITKENIILSPNPATDKCVIHSPEGIMHNVTVFDYAGRKIKKIPDINAFEIEIKLSGYPSGIYFIHVATVLGVVTQKIIKQ